jgi:hypothetical protein
MLSEAGHWPAMGVFLRGHTPGTHQYKRFVGRC